MAARKRWWIGGIAGALLITGVTWRLAHASPFGFLDEFDPKVYDVDYTLIYTPPVPKRVKAVSPRARVYVFPPSRSTEVLTALKRELTVWSPSGAPPNPFGEQWQFIDRIPGRSEQECPAAFYYTGSIAIYIIEVYRAGPHPEPGEKSCAVLVTWKRSWLEEEWVRMFG